jgi:CPA2 family monovalent cation:H+ antiporter-2
MAAQTAQLATAVAGISMMLTPVLAICARWVAARVQNIDHGRHMPPGDAAEFKDHVVIGGFGRVGQTVGRMLAAENVPFVALDTNGDLVAEARRHAGKVYFGDAARKEFLDRIGAAQARAFVVTVN